MDLAKARADAQARVNAAAEALLATYCGGEDPAHRQALEHLAKVLGALHYWVGLTSGD